MTEISKSSFVILFIAQIACIVLYSLCTTYHSEASAKDTAKIQTLQNYYPFYQDVHVMIFIGFGFLMTFLQKYGFSSIGLNFLIACFTIELAIVASGFRSKVLHDEEFRIGIVR